jgi:hypothetical protein
MTLGPQVNQTVLQQAAAAFTHDVNNANALRDSLAETVAANAAAMADTTIRQYAPYQRKWESWCLLKGFSDGKLVGEDKLLLFLKEVVVSDGGAPPASDAGEDGTDAKEGRAAAEDQQRSKVSAQTASCIVSAIVKMWELQVANGSNTRPHPRGNVVKGFIKQMMTQDAKRRRDLYIDKQAETVDSKYSNVNFEAVNAFCLKDPHQSKLLMRAMWLLSSAMVARGDNVRSAELPDLFAVPLDDVPQQHECVMLLMERSKTNQEGELEYAGMLRHKDAEKCPVQAIAFYFFYRFHMSGESFPDMSQRKNWFHTPVFLDEKTGKAMGYSKHYNQIQRVCVSRCLCEVKKKKEMKAK